MIYDSDIEKAAIYLVVQHGDKAVQQAENHARDLRRDGSDDIAEAWQRVAQFLGADAPLG